MAGKSKGDIGCAVIILIISACGIMAAIFMSKELNQLINWLVH